MSQGSVSHTALGPGGEFDRIRAVLKRLGLRAASSGDDCALVTIGDQHLAISTDLAIEGTHFRAGWLRPDEIGWRAGAAALSDLAAVGATPLGVLASVGAQLDWPEEFLADLMEGVGAAAHAVGATVWGGDLVRSERLVIDLMVVGRADVPVLRAGARPSDGLWVTGALGAPHAAVRSWEEGREPDAGARERFAHPVPRVTEAHWLRDSGATAMIDVSDGLVGDAGHLAAASSVKCVIESERVPVHGAADAPHDALVSGEEYELLATLPAGFSTEDATRFEEQFGLALTRVGSVRDGSGVLLLEASHPVDVPAGFRQFD
ncbi:MAG: thiamine-phosphate kinase [Gemmatimonadota bacterium]|nr:thiamine-phosphate kinase [Gemmatimonadota bacterium]